MIKEKYCSFEVSKLLKEKGFNEQCRTAYTNYGQIFTTQIQQYITNIVCSKGKIWECTAPTHQMAMDWLREVHKLNIGIVRGPNGYHITIETIPLGVVKYITREITGTTYVDSYENAVESALKFILENLI